MLSKILISGFDNDDSIDIIRLFRDHNVYAEIFYEQENNEHVTGIFANEDKQEEVVNWDKPLYVGTVASISNETVVNFINDNKINQDWTMENYLEYIKPVIKETVGDDRVLLALSGGVDSSVVATLLREVIGDQLQCMYVDHGLMRKNESAEIEAEFIGRQKMNLKMIDASNEFLGLLEGIDDPEQKRKIIGNEFIETFINNIDEGDSFKFLAQGTIYPDVVESMKLDGQFTKSHHNVGGLPEKLGFELLEPMALLFKNEVRELGFLLGLPESVVLRQPFPGPGIAVRIIGDITRDKIKIVQETDFILREEVKKAGIDRDIWQYFTVLTNIKSVGVKDGQRSYDYTVGIRAVNTIDAVTAQSYRFPYEVLEVISARITSEVVGVNRVVYDVSNKPPATIEWE